MMSVKLIFQNLKQNVRDYLIYFMTLVLAIAIYYAFNAVTSAEALKSLSEEMITIVETLGTTIEYISFIISFLLGFLILYVNKFLLKRRKKELGVYMLLGMRKAKISAIFVGETFMIGICSLAAGTIAGIFLGQILTVAALRVFGGEVNSFLLTFSPHAFKVTLISFGIIYLLAMVLNISAVSGVKLIDLLNAERKNEELNKKKSGAYAVAFIAGVIALLGGALCFRSDNAFPEKTQMMAGFFLIVAATLLIFYSFSAVILLIAKKNKRFYYRDINSFLVRQLGSRVQGNFLSMSAVCLLLTLTMLLVTVGISMAVTTAKNVQTDTPYDFIVFYNDGQEQNVSITELAAQYEHSVDLNPMIAESYEFVDRMATDLTYADVFGKDAKLWAHDKGLLECNVEVIGITDYNNLLALQDKDPVSLGENEFYLNCNYKGTYTYAEQYMKDGTETVINGVALSPAQNTLLEENVEMTSVGDNDRGTFVVPDEVARKGIIYEYVLEGYWNEGVDTAEANEKLNDLTIYDLKNSPFSWNTKARMRTMYYSAIGIPIFLCTYCGLIFLLICVALLAVQQLTEISDNQKRYRILEKQGVPEHMMHSTIKKQIAVYFVAPFILGFFYLLSSIRVVIGKVSLFCNMEIGAYIIPSMAVILLIYVAYYVAAVWSCDKMVFIKKGL